MHNFLSWHALCSKWHALCSKSACTMFQMGMYNVPSEHVQCSKWACAMFQVGMHYVPSGMHSEIPSRHAQCSKWACATFQAWVETWCRIWGDTKIFLRPNFRKNFHFQGKNF